MASIKSTRSLTLDIPPSCIEFVPGHPELFVVGTYYLERKDEEGHDATESTAGQPQQRTGSLLLFELKGEEVILQHTLSTPFAIFDIHFAPASTSSPTPLLGAATSTGSLALYEISASVSSTTPSITPLSVLQIFPTTSIITFFAWHPTIPFLAALALSSGSIYVCDTATIAATTSNGGDSTPVLEDGDTTPSAAYLHAHALEAWFVAFTPDGCGLLSGGDDSTLASLALPLPHRASSAQELLAAIADADEPPAVQWQDRKTHQAGVTAILPLPLAPSPSSSSGEESQPPLLLLTGSYDDHIRLLALPTPTSFPRRPKVLTELDLGGGVWRLKDVTGTKPEGVDEKSGSSSGGYEYTILASCMHAGARVLRLKGSSQDEGGEDGDLEWSFEVLAAFEEHKSMNYGSDVQPGEGGRKVVSTSFYDRLLAMWTW